LRVAFLFAACLIVITVVVTCLNAKETPLTPPAPAPPLDAHAAFQQAVESKEGKPDGTEVAVPEEVCARFGQPAHVPHLMACLRSRDATCS
jgi:hypothetical protein